MKQCQKGFWAQIPIFSNLISLLEMKKTVKWSNSCLKATNKWFVYSTNKKKMIKLNSLDAYWIFTTASSNSLINDKSTKESIFQCPWLNVVYKSICKHDKTEIELELRCHSYQKRCMQNGIDKIVKWTMTQHLSMSKYFVTCTGLKVKKIMACHLKID